MALPGSALIVGGGIAGLTLSIALRRMGVPVEIAEIKSEWKVYGVGIILQSNGIRALDTLGLAERCMAAGFPYSVSRQCNRRGEPFYDRPKPNVSGDRFASSCGMLRRALHEILCEEARRLGVAVRLGTSVSAFAQDEAGVDVGFTDGTRGNFDLVVGADGVNSGIRRLLFGEQHQPRYTGQSCWRFTAPRHPDVEGAHLYHGDGKVAGLVPVSQEQMYLLLLTEEPGNPRMPGDQLHRLLRERLQGFGGVVGDIRETINDPGEVVYSPLEPIMMPPPWSRGRVILMGDAVHAPTPHLAQGASMAIEDAIVLAQELAQSNAVADALTRFATRRHARCREIVDASVRVGEGQMKRESSDELIRHTVRALEALRTPI